MTEKRFTLEWYAKEHIRLTEENEQLKEDLEYKERVIKQYQQTQEENMENCQGDVE